MRPDNYLYLEEQAREAMERAHAPYSDYYVGTAVLADNGKVYSAPNVEFKPRVTTVHSEVMASAKAMEDGAESISHAVLITSGDDAFPPCGPCRNVLATINPEMEILVVTGEGEADVYNLSDLLPHAYT